MKNRVDLMLDDKLLNKAKSKAKSLGLNLSAYIRLLIAQDKE